jgi:diguanylate cyclase (GGDEF)-like protein/PAS domain S-box-containing protein
MSDMTENNTTENNRILSEEEEISLWRALIDYSPDIVTVHDAHGRVRFASPSSEKYFGKIPKNLKVDLDPIFRLIHEDDVRDVRHEFSKLAKGPGAVVGPITFRMKTQDGKWRYLESVACNLLNNDQINGILVTTRDVTERMEIERALAQSEYRYRRLVERSPEAIAVINDNKISYANPACIRILGASGLTQLSEFEVLEFIKADDRERVRHALELVILGEDITSIPANIVSLDGRLITSEITGIPIIYDGKPSLQVVVRDVTEQKRAMEALEYQSMHDPLTHLPNRALFMDRVTQALGRAQRLGSHLVVMLADIDRFKIVNDSLSHAVGDKILIGVAERLQACFRPSDTVARFGGDEFVVLCEETDELTNLGTLGERILRAMQKPIVVDGESFHLSISVGISEAVGAGQKADDLLRDADTAMNRAKERGRGVYEIFDENTGRTVAARLQTESQLRHGISHGEMRAYYQPVVDATTGIIVGAEALVRWQHPEKGLIYPNDFIPIAEESGLIVPLGAWMLAEACQQLKEWSEEFDESRHFKMSVNLSPRQFMDLELVSTVKDILESINLDRSRFFLQLEVTEGMLTDDKPEIRNIMKAFNDLGVGIVIDDFGTGYSSFGYLKKFPVTTLKIDRSFVSGLGSSADDQAIVTAIIQLARALNIEVVAEGVETIEQLLHLRNSGCNLIQGYYFSKPKPKEEISEILSTPFSVPPLKI